MKKDKHVTREHHLLLTPRDISITLERSLRSLPRGPLPPGAVGASVPPDLCHLGSGNTQPELMYF